MSNSSIKFTSESLGQISLFEKVTRAKIKDCFEDANKQLVFVVVQGDLQKAIGKQAKNVQKLKNLFNKNIRIIEFNEDVCQFVANVARPIKVLEVMHDGNGVYTIIPPDVKSRGLLIGRNARVLRDNELIVKRYHSIQELRVQ